MKHHLQKGEISYMVLFFIATIAVFLVGGGTVLDSQYNIFGNRVVGSIAGGKNTEQLSTLIFVTITPRPTSANPSPTTIIPNGSSVTSPTLPPGSSPTNPPFQSPNVSPSSAPSGTSSLLCGTNLGLFNDGDFVNNTAAQNALQQLHVSTLRMPWRQDVDASGARLLKAVTITHQLGITPLVILHMGGDSASINGNKNIIQQINTIMGGAKVYYEFGNEPTGGFANYISLWNQGVGPLKAVAQNAWFGGPVWFENFQPSEISGMATFIQQANPKPDFLSWHEYTCGASNTAAYCFQHLANWKTHFDSTKQANGGTLPPVFITEWNYDAAAPGTGNDPRIAQLNGMHFIQTALNDLKTNGVYAAYQYVLNTNADYNLFNGNALTAAGQEFARTCTSL